MQCGSRLISATSSVTRCGLERAAQLGQAQAQQVHDRDLAQERLRRRHPDLEARAREQHAVGVARGLRAHHVRDRQHPRAALARHPHRRERVGGLARLADPDHEIARAEHRVAVAVLRGDVHLDRQPRPLLDRVAPDQAGVVGGAAGDDHDPAHVREQRLVQRALPRPGPPPSPAAVRSADRLGDRVGLFMDLLEHERLIPALLGGVLVPVDRLHRPLQLLARGRRDRDAVGAQHDDLVVVEELHLAWSAPGTRAPPRRRTARPRRGRRSAGTRGARRRAPRARPGSSPRTRSGPRSSA